MEVLPFQNGQQTSKKTSVPIQPERSHPDAIKKTGAVEAPVYLCEEGYACLKN
jgi:hypothetical protein